MPSKIAENPDYRSSLALFSYGFRPFFLFGSAWAVMAMLLWILMLEGRITLPTAFDSVSWHAHAFVVGYLGAVLGGFLLTAVPNWTRSRPVTGALLAGLFCLWVSGRVAVSFSAELPWLLVAVLDLAYFVALLMYLLHAIYSGRNWRNFVIAGLLVALVTGIALFHLNSARGETAAQGAGFRLMLAAAVMMIAVIGGRIVPAFTGNWLKARAGDLRPAPPMTRFDKMTLAVTLLSLALWVTKSPGAGPGLILSGLLHFARLSRWRGLQTLSEPLLLVLHVAYCFVPIGAAALGLALIADDPWLTATALHFWAAGAIGLMTLAVMTRATLGHTGRPLQAGFGSVAVYSAMIGSVLTRVSAGVLPDFAHFAYAISAALWVMAFGGFLVLYGPMLLRLKRE